MKGIRSRLNENGPLNWKLHVLNEQEKTEKDRKTLLLELTVNCSPILAYQGTDSHAEVVVTLEDIRHRLDLDHYKKSVSRSWLFAELSNYTITYDCFVDSKTQLKTYRKIQAVPLDVIKRLNEKAHS